MKKLKASINLLIEIMAKQPSNEPKPSQGSGKKRNSKLDPILKKYYEYWNNILWNSTWRIIVCVLMCIFLLYLLYAFISTVQQSTNWLLPSFVSGTSIVMALFPIKYLWANYNQLSYETELNKSISSLKWRLKSLQKPSGKKNYRSIQAGITELRNNLIGYLNNSLIVSLPISNFELNRLKQRMDIFFNCASETLVPINKLFSLEDEIEDYYFGERMQTADEEAEQEWKQHNRQESGEFTEFDLDAMDEFLDHLWDVLFDREPKRYSLYGYKHPINLILLSRFFVTWNQKIAVCDNCKQVFAKAEQDIEAYYKSVTELEGENRQRKWRLRDDVIIVIASVSISTIIQYLISFT